MKYRVLNGKSKLTTGGVIKNLVMLPFCGYICCKIWRLARKFGTYRSVGKLKHWLRPVKHSLGYALLALWMSNIGQMGHMTVEHLQEHVQYIGLNQHEKSSLVEHCLKDKTSAIMESTSLISTAENFGNQVILEAITTQNDFKAINRDMGLSLDSCWMPVLQLIIC